MASAPLHHRVRVPFVYTNQFTQEEIMNRKPKKQLAVRKDTKKIADSRRVRFGSGFAPAKVIRSDEVATYDSRAVRFGSGFAPASLKKVTRS